MYFSIIIPVYNTEKYLKDCVRSVLCQSFTDFEIILINDGSTDNSGEICDELAVMDNRIKVIHQENKGVSCTRNVGIKASQGEYVGFVDSDDILLQGCFFKLHEVTQKYNNDVVSFSVRIITDNEEKFDEFNFIEHADLTQNQELYFQEITAAYIYSKIYKRSFLLDNNLFFNEKITLWEDTEYTARVLSYCKNYTRIKECFYDYNLQSNATSITRRSHLCAYQDAQVFLCSLKNIINRLEYLKLGEKRYLYYRQVLTRGHFYYLIMPDKKISIKQRIPYIKELVDNDVMREDCIQQLLENDFSFAAKPYIFCLKHKLTKLLISYIAIKNKILYIISNK